MSKPQDIDNKPETGEKHVIYVVDDNAEILEAIQELLTSVDLNVITFTSGEQFISSVDANTRGCLLLDLRMPGMSGLEVQYAMKKKLINMPIIFLTGHGEVGTAVQAMREGAVDFIEKPFLAQALLERVHACLQIDERIKDEKKRQETARNALGQLTQRELEIARMIVTGKPSKIVASEINISEKTVDVHRHNIFKKLSIKSTSELLQIWVDAGYEIA
jgi:two-component system response regulator FixJ